MKFAGVGIGPRDLAGGLDLLLKTRDAGMPWISANIYGNGDIRMFDPYRLVSYGNLDIALVAVTGPGMQSDEFTIKDADPELSSLMPELDSRADIIILLSTLPFQQTAETAKNFTQIDIAITADRSRGNTQPIHSGNAIVMQTASRGQYLGLLDAEWRGQPWKKDNAAETAKLKRQLKSLTMQLDQLRSLPPEPRAEKTAVLEDKRQQLLNRIKELEQEAAPADQIKLSTYQCSFLPLSGSVRKDPGIERIVSAAKKRITDVKAKKRPGS